MLLITKDYRQILVVFLFSIPFPYSWKNHGIIHFLSFLLFKKCRIYQHFKAFYLSKLFIVGISFNVCLSLCVFCRNHNKIKACRLFYIDFAFVLFCLLFLIHGKNYGKKATQTFLLEWLILLTIQF